MYSSVDAMTHRQIKLITSEPARASTKIEIMNLLEHRIRKSAKLLITNWTMQIYANGDVLCALYSAILYHLCKLIIHS